MRKLTACAASILVIGTGLRTHVVRAAPPPGGTLIWSDEFSGNAVDPTKWTCNNPGVWGDAINTPRAVTVENGAMKIATYTDPANGKHYNAVMGTQDNFLTTYGYFEARVQFNSSPGMWSAFWLNSPTVGDQIGHPEVSGVEIDVVEHRATNDTGANISNKYNTALHWDGYGEDHATIGHLNGPIPDLANGVWHTYGVNWTPDGYTMYMDGVERWNFSAPVSDARQYLLLSSEVDNSSWAGFVPAGGYGSQSASSTNMLVDYVRVYSNVVPEPGASLSCLALAGVVTRAGRRRRAGRVADAAISRDC